LVHETYLEIKQELGDTVVDQIDPGAEPRERYRQIWLATYTYLRKEPERARFLTQLEESPFYTRAHQMVLERGDRLIEEANRPDLRALLVDLPMEVLWSLSLGMAVRIVASGIALTDKELNTLIDSTWRAVTG
jgi:AcrR family transcriptional regulator